MFAGKEKAEKEKNGKEGHNRDRVAAEAAKLSTLFAGATAAAVAAAMAVNLFFDRQTTDISMSTELDVLNLSICINAGDKCHAKTALPEMSHNND